MARTCSWLQRLPEIRRRVAENVRSHYTREDLQELFEVQRSPAGRLLEALPTVTVNSSHLVESGALLKFLDRVKETDDVSALLNTMRNERRAPSRRKLRSLVRRTYAPVGFEGLPDNLELRPGYMGIQYETIDQLVETQLLVAKLLSDELDEFSRRYEPKPPQQEDEDAAEVRRLFASLPA